MPRKNHTHTKRQGHKKPKQRREVMRLDEPTQTKPVRTSIRVGQTLDDWRKENNL